MGAPNSSSPKRCEWPGFAPPLRLLLLGPPLLVTAAGEQLQLRTRKHFALLIRLAVEAGKRFTRDYLMELLWPAAAAPLARHSLAQALTVVKDAIGREHLLVQRATDRKSTRLNSSHSSPSR